MRFGGLFSKTQELATVPILASFKLTSRFYFLLGFSSAQAIVILASRSFVLYLIADACMNVT